MDKSYAQLLIHNLVGRVMKGGAINRNKIDDSRSLKNITIKDILKYQENACLPDTGRNINKVIMINGIAHDLKKLGRDEDH